MTLPARLAQGTPVTLESIGKRYGNRTVLDNIQLRISAGQFVAVVGRSGCGKSTLGRTITRLYEPTEGKILYDGTDISHLTGPQLLPYRKRIQMIFQDPYASLDSRMTVMDIIREALDLHSELTTKEQRSQRVYELLDHVGLMREHANRYPHEFSGGQRQRLCIARALEVMPEVLVCDEPVSALDVSIQAQVLNLMKDIQKEMNLTYLFIAHDLSVVQYMSDRIVVMYLGKIVEIADSRALYDEPLHPYTQALLSAIPVPDIHKTKKRQVLEGEVPSPIHKPSGCAFHNRCPKCMEICKTVDPAMVHHGAEGHMVACHLYDKEAAKA